MAQLSEKGRGTHHYASPQPSHPDYGEHAARVAARAAASVQQRQRNGEGRYLAAAAAPHAGGVADGAAHADSPTRVPVDGGGCSNIGGGGRGGGGADGKSAVCLGADLDRTRAEEADGRACGQAGGARVSMAEQKTGEGGNPNPNPGPFADAQALLSMERLSLLKAGDSGGGGGSNGRGGDDGHGLGGGGGGDGAREPNKGCVELGGDPRVLVSRAAAALAQLHPRR